MAQNIRLKHSATQDKAPLPTDLLDGEVALNINANSPALYTKDSAGNIVKLAGAGAIGGTPATETAAGIAELATQTETNAGTDDERIVTPLKLATKLASAGTGGTGNFGYWNRTGTVVSPTNAGDAVEMSAGTAALPGLTPVGDPNTGFHSPGPDQIALSTNAKQAWLVDENQNTTFAGIVTIGSLSANLATRRQYEETEIKKNAAFSVGLAGAIPFGVGPAIPPGMAFFGIGSDAYNPIHLLSGSFC